ncbi:hypothetical protein EYF80_023393 [Liparis tanakae]|uniref:Uncharacterized protein n=1 Tax=Liparis tanakae TaxID=230148 RepID=A0A4Z2HN29_9TELE|nr:hypothetical protein EYF80_023393 [Liparis tanakae]
MSCNIHVLKSTDEETNGLKRQNQYAIVSRFSSVSASVPCMRLCVVNSGAVIPLVLAHWAGQCVNGRPDNARADKRPQSHRLDH